MGDKRRFDLFANMTAAKYGKRASSLRIADVAGGLGYLQVALRERCFRNVTTWDTRTKHVRLGVGYRRQLFSADAIGDKADLIVGMHPDEATDQIIEAASRLRVPFLVVPCCIKPSAWTYWGGGDRHDWIKHLRREAERRKLHTTLDWLKMTGCNTVIIGEP